MNRLNNNFLKNARWQERKKIMRPQTLSQIGGTVFLAVAAGYVIGTLMAWMGYGQ